METVLVLRELLNEINRFRLIKEKDRDVEVKDGMFTSASTSNSISIGLLYAETMVKRFIKENE
jgi:hypothetical protein